MFSDNYLRLCNERNIAPTALAEKLGYTRAAGVRWISGSVPRKATLRRIADYFGVTMESLVEDAAEAVQENKKTTAIFGSGSVADKISRLSPELLEVFVRFLDIAEADPAKAKRFLDFAVEEIQNGSESH